MGQVHFFFKYMIIFQSTLGLLGCTPWAPEENLYPKEKPQEGGYVFQVP